MFARRKFSDGPWPAPAREPILRIKPIRPTLIFVVSAIVGIIALILYMAPTCTPLPGQATCVAEYQGELLLIFTAALTALASAATGLLREGSDEPDSNTGEGGTATPERAEPVISPMPTPVAHERAAGGPCSGNPSVSDHAGSGAMAGQGPRIQPAPLPRQAGEPPPEGERIPGAAAFVEAALVESAIAEPEEKEPKAPPFDSNERQFERWFDHILKVEGQVLSVDTNDARVCVGVNEAYHPDLPFWSTLESVKPGEQKPVTNHLLLREIKEFYRDEFWDRPVCRFFIPWPDLRFNVADCYVRTGYGRIRVTIQRWAGCDVDGKWGPGTRQAVKDYLAATDEFAANNAFCDVRQAMLDEEVAKSPTKRAMAAGLKARIDACRI